MNYLLIGLLVVAVVAAVVAFRVFGERVRCPFCREWLPRGAAYYAGRKGTESPYLCPFCDHVVRKRDLQGSV
jgi:hypothetical protein